MKEQLATFLNSDYLMEALDTKLPDTEISAMKTTLSQFNEEELAQALSVADSVLEVGYPQYAEIKTQVVNAEANRSGVVELASVAELLAILREQLDTVACLVLFARILGENKLEVGKFKYQGKSVLPSIVGLFKQKNAK